MSELKSFIVLYDGKFIRAYDESEADKVIADLEESHKMEVGQLLIKIAELKDKLRHYPMMAALIENGNKDINKQKDLNHALMLDALRDRDRIRHLKYKRCLAMADMCAERRMYWTYRLQDDGDKGYSKDYKFGKNCFWRKWCVRWLAIAEKFKDAK